MIAVGDTVYIESGAEPFEVVGFEFDGAVVKLAGRRIALFERERFSVYTWRVGRSREKRTHPSETQRPAELTQGRPSVPDRGDTHRGGSLLTADHGKPPDADDRDRLETAPDARGEQR